MLGTVLLAIYVLGVVFISGYILPKEVGSPNAEWRLAIMVILAWPFFVGLAILNRSIL